FRTFVPRRRPSVGFMQMARTRFSPICWATSATMETVSPSRSISISSAVLISGMPSGGNSTSTTGPAMATTRPSFSSVSVRSGASVIGNCASSLRSSFGVGVAPQVLAKGLLATLPAELAEGLGATDDLGDLGGDGVLAGAVHHAREADDELVGVVGRGLHRPLPGGGLRRRRALQRRGHARFGVNRAGPPEGTLR